MQLALQSPAGKGAYVTLNGIVVRDAVYADDVEGFVVRLVEQDNGEASIPAIDTGVVKIFIQSDARKRMIETFGELNDKATDPSYFRIVKPAERPAVHSSLRQHRNGLPGNRRVV